MATIFDHTTGKDRLYLYLDAGRGSHDRRRLYLGERSIEVHKALTEHFIKIGRPVSENEIIGIKVLYSVSSEGTGMLSSSNPIESLLNSNERKLCPSHTYTAFNTGREKKKAYQSYYEYTGTVLIVAPVSELRKSVPYTIYELDQRRAKEQTEHRKAEAAVIRSAEPLAKKLEGTRLAETMFSKLDISRISVAEYLDYFLREASIGVDSSRYYSQRRYEDMPVWSITFESIGFRLDSPLAPVAVGIAYGNYLKKRFGVNYEIRAALPNGQSCSITLLKPVTPASEKPPLTSI